MEKSDAMEKEDTMEKKEPVSFQWKEIVRIMNSSFPPYSIYSSSQGLYLYTNTEKRTPQIHALSEIRTHDPGFRASEDGACLRSLDYRDRQPLL
jgi:hypothetical protein